MEDEDLAKKMIQDAKEEHKPFIDPIAVSNSRVIIPQIRQMVSKMSAIPFQTHTFLDELFLGIGDKILQGIPTGIQLGITGLPSSGKSILMQQIAVKVAGGFAGSGCRNVLFVTSEDTWSTKTNRLDLEARCVQKAELLMLDWNTIRDHLFVIDVASFPELRDWSEFVKTYRFACENYKIDLVLIDSVTALEDYRGALKNRIRELSVYNQSKGITAIFVNQRAVEEADGYGVAGGIGLAHNMDGIIVIDYTRAYQSNLKEDLNAKHQESLRFVRVLGCRLAPFDAHYHRLEITKEGLLKMISNPEKQEKEEKK